MVNNTKSSNELLKNIKSHEKSIGFNRESLSLMIYGSAVSFKSSTISLFHKFQS